MKELYASSCAGVKEDVSTGFFSALASPVVAMIVLSAKTTANLNRYFFMIIDALLVIFYAFSLHFFHFGHTKPSLLQLKG